MQGSLLYTLSDSLLVKSSQFTACMHACSMPSNHGTTSFTVSYPAFRSYLRMIMTVFLYFHEEMNEKNSIHFDIVPSKYQYTFKQGML